MTQALVIGESHANALILAVKENPSTYGGIDVRRLASARRRYLVDAIALSRAMEMIAALPRTTPVFLSMLGTYHNVLGLVKADRDYDFLLDANDIPNRDTATIRLPHRAIANVFQAHLSTGGAVSKLRAAGRSKLYLLSSPPPKQSNEFIMRKFMMQTNHDYKGRSIDEVGLSPPEIRLKLWRLETRLIAQWAEDRAMEFIPAPHEAFNADGFLARKFYADDATHANARYGELVLRQIAALSGEMMKEAGDHG